MHKFFRYVLLITPAICVWSWLNLASANTEIKRNSLADEQQNINNNFVTDSNYQKISSINLSINTEQITEISSAKIPKTPNIQIADLKSGQTDADKQLTNNLIESEQFGNTTDADASDDGMEQITNVSQLQDVQPSDWAYEALRSLVERYGCIAGYPDSTFRGNRTLTRYEFAAGMNACLAQIEKLITGNTANSVNKEDLDTLQKLRQEFDSEIANLRTKVDALEARTGELESNNFSTTTRLNGTISFNVAAARATGKVKAERVGQDVFSGARRDANNRPTVIEVEDDPSATVSHATTLFLSTSFTGKDNLTTTLITGNGNAPVNNYTSAGWYNTYGSPVLNLTPVAQANSIEVTEAFYSFPVNDSLQLVVAPRIFWLRYFDTNVFSSTFGKGTSGFNTFGSTLVNDLGRGAGAIALWQISEQFDLRVGYVATGNAANPNTGLFAGTRAFSTQLTYSPNGNVNLRLLYDRSNIKPVDGQITTKPIIGVADDGLGGAIEDATSNSVVFNFDWLVTPKFGLFGRYTYADTHLDPKTPGVAAGSVKAQSVQVGVAFPDFGRKGALATLSYVVPFSVLDGRKYLVSGGGDRGTEFDIEATYFFPLTDNIALIPTFHFIGNPNNFNDNPNIYTGTLLTRFSF